MQERCRVSGRIPFGAILSISSRARVIYLNERLLPYDISSGQVPVLMLLYNEQNITQDTLVRHFRLDKGTIARAVKKLVDAGYVRRITDPDNRRAVRLFLTEKGEEITPVIRSIEREWEAKVCTGLSPRERRNLTMLMRQVTRNSIQTIME
ncbi:MAG: MarR family transcriptional regulator [Methanoregulaceae archaeon]